MNPITGQFLGPNSTIAIGAIVPNTGNSTNGIFVAGQGITKTAFEWPAIALAPRFGMAYDLTGEQRFVVRGGAGLFFDRPSGNSVFAQVLNPPNLENVTVRNGQLQTLGSGGLTTLTPPALNVFEYDSDLPSSIQWNGGVQMTLPWAMALDVSYVGQHQYDILQNMDINRVDFGAAFLPENQDPTLAASTTAGGRRRHRPDAGVPGIQLDHADLGMAEADLSLAAAVAAAAVPQRPVVRVQRHHRPLRSPEHDAAAAARRRRHASRSAPTRPKPIGCSATTIRRRTSSRRTSCGTCRTSAAVRRCVRRSA